MIFEKTIGNSASCSKLFKDHLSKFFFEMLLNKLARAWPLKMLSVTLKSAQIKRYLTFVKVATETKLVS